jgi:hypothetical protein
MVAEEVGPVGVLLDPPGLDHDLGHGQAGEFLDVEQLVADPAIERLDIGHSTITNMMDRDLLPTSLGELG